MLKMFKKTLQTSNQIGILTKSIQDSALAGRTQKFRFSGGHHSDSEHSDHSDHSEHSDHHSHSVFKNEIQELNQETRQRIFAAKKDVFSVEDLLNNAKKPLVSQSKGFPQVQMHQTEEEYIKFLAENFERVTLQKYPEYKKDLDKFVHRIPDFDRMNAYQKEVFTLDAYLHWRLETVEDETRAAYDFKGTSLEQARERFRFFEKLTKENHHDNKIMHHLREKLHEVLESELKFEEFKKNYNDKIQNVLINKIMEKTKQNSYYKIVENKKDINQTIHDFMAPENHARPKPHCFPHDHIHQQHFLKDPKQANAEKFKYLAYFDIILDQHIRQVRPENQKDDVFKYVKEEYKVPRVYYDDVRDNMYYDYKFTMDNEFYLKFVEEINKNAPGKEAAEDPNRPAGKLWKDKHKFPHVADRLGWHYLQETTVDKNILIERVESHPAYQWQPFVQVPSYEPNKDVCLEQGETLYENKKVYEWVMFWRFLVLLLPLPLLLLVFENYNTQTASSGSYLARTGLFIPPGNMTEKGLPRRHIEKLLYWGSDLWYHQHWYRKGLLYISVFMVGLVLKRGIPLIGHDYVIKAIYNRQKDCLFVWKTTKLLRKEMHVYELHYLEQPCAPIISSWKFKGAFKKDGLTYVKDLRFDDDLVFYNENKYWNAELKDHFFKNTTTFWNGLRHRNLDEGLFINNSTELNAERYALAKQTTEEIKKAIEKYGPIALTDYDLDYQYQIKKRVVESKRDFVQGAMI